jgi:CelD/BcsL family acetyltransferase involved in cellulose biosynthesis
LGNNHHKMKSLGTIPMRKPEQLLLGKKEYSVRIFTDRNDLALIEDEWRSFQSGISNEVNIDFSMYNVLMKTMETVEEPMIVFVNDGPALIGMIVGRIEKADYTSGIGYFNILRMKCRRMVVMSGGILFAEPGIMQTIGRVFLREIARDVAADFVLYNCIKIDADFKNYASQLRFPFSLAIKYKAQPHRMMIIPDSMDAFYKTKSSKHKKNISYYIRKLKDDNANEMQVKCFTNMDQMEQLFIDAETIAQKTYQRGMEEGFKADKLTRDRFRCAAERGWLRSYILYVKGVPVTFQMGFVYKNIYFVQGKGYDPAFRDYRVGTTLFVHILEDLINNKIVTVWDFGIGDADYKIDYGNSCHDEQTIVLFSKTLKGFSLYFISTFNIFLQKMLESVVLRFGFYNKIKRLWRNRFQSRHSSAKT